jgi:membrane-associated phospholipid phosphatase
MGRSIMAGDAILAARSRILRWGGAVVAASLSLSPGLAAAQRDDRTADVVPAPRKPGAKRPAKPKHRGKTPRVADIDVVTGAGVFESPPPRRPSLTPSPEDKVVWNPAWRPFELVDYVSTGVFLAGSFAVLAIPPTEDRWLVINDLDAEVRKVLRPEGQDGRDAARDASDILLMFAVNQILVDTFIVTWWGHDAGSVAYQMALINVQALGFNAAINGLVSGLASRQRPYGPDECVGEANTELDDCRSNKRYRSFFSGHTSTTFTVAGLTCLHHAYLPLYGNPALDALACVASIGVANATGIMRIVADVHWASDVIVGAAMGTVSGTLVPWLLHYRTGQMPEPPKPGEVSVQLVPTPAGAHLSGAF